MTGAHSHSQMWLLVSWVSYIKPQNMDLQLDDKFLYKSKTTISSVNIELNTIGFNDTPINKSITEMHPLCRQVIITSMKLAKVYRFYGTRTDKLDAQ
jgi:hypothetical protein